MRPPLAGGPPADVEIPIGRVFGPYKILSAIQRGGMGELFLAERVDRRAGPNKVVLKRLLADYLEDERYVRMFRAEAKVMSSLDHPNIVKVFDVPVIDGKQCLAMEYVHGRNLAQILRRCRELHTAIPPQVSLHIIMEVLRGLDYAHNFVLDDGRPLGLVHRDVTPPNILVSFDGAVKITDFGISKSEMSSVSTTIGVVKGTTRYLAPEQIRGQPATPRSDLFSAAVVLIEAITGEALFDHGTVPPTLFAIVTGQRKPIHELLPFVAPRLTAALERALDLHPERRHRSAREFADALDEAERELGRPIDKSALSVFLKELFREAEMPADLEEDIGPWQLNAMDLTYLFEVQELHAFKTDPPAPPANRSNELERVKALLKAAVPGASPLDADQFSSATEPGKERPPPEGPGKAELIQALTSHSIVRRVETRMDRPATSEHSEERLADTADVFSDPTQTTDDVPIIESSRNEDSHEAIRIDPASLPQAKLPLERLPIERLPIERVPLERAPIQQPPLFEERTDVAPTEKKERSQAAPPPERKSRVVAFFFGLILGASAWSQVWRIEHLLPVRLAPPPRAATIRTGDPPVTYPSIQHRHATAHEGTRRGAARAASAEPPRALLTVRKPAGARVRLNGTWLEEKTPLVGYAIAPGEYKIEVKKKKTRKYRIEAKAGESIDLNRRSASPPKSPSPAN